MSPTYLARPSSARVRVVFLRCFVLALSVGYGAPILGVDRPEDVLPLTKEMKVAPRQVAPRRNAATRSTAGMRSLCVIGCTPYVDFTVETTGYAKYKALVNDLVRDCAAIVHVGDTKPPAMPCNTTLMTRPVHYLKSVAKVNKRLLLYAPGDNEISDCHRLKSLNQAADIYSASAARQFFVSNLRLNTGRDVTGTYGVRAHAMNGTIPGAPDGRTYSCDFDKYVSFDNFAVATLEVPGGHWYLEDESNEYPDQDSVDPLSDRFWMYMNARDCALDWLDTTAQLASAAGKRTLFLLFHAAFYGSQGSTALSNDGIGPFYSTSNMLNFTALYAGRSYSQPYQPLFAKLTELGLKYPALQFVVVHADGHKVSMNRLNPTLTNQGLEAGKLFSNHNVMVHMVEGDSKGLTMYSKFTVDSTQFYPVTHQQRWSKAAYDTPPLGHSRIAY